jgi:hypothetical protein
VSVTRRYLTKNVFNKDKLPKKEKLRDSIESIRKIQYSTMAIMEKQKEEMRLR